jgi:TRAP-type C4-dicarboxylate transport system permease small subunit
MDVLLRFMPEQMRYLLRIAEQVLLVVLAGFVLSQSYVYAGSMLRIGRTSDMAGVPMWIPHGAVALGFALMLLIACWRFATALTRRTTEQAAPVDGKIVQ